MKKEKYFIYCLAVCNWEPSELHTA